MSSKQIFRSSWSSTKINDAYKGFAIVGDIENGVLYMFKKQDGLYRYEFATDSWIKLTIIPEIQVIQSSQRCIMEVFNGINSIYITPVAIDCNQGKIMLNYAQGSVAIFELYDNDEVKMITVSDLAIGKYLDSRAIMINQKFHIIGVGEYFRKKHIKYDPISQTITVLHQFVDIFDLNHIVNHEIVRIKNKILMFGGYNGHYFLNNIYEYNIEDNKWTQLNCTMPKRMVGFGCVVILNKEYVALFGGGNDVDAYDDIFIFSVQDKTFKKSKIKCPFACNFRAFAFNDRKKDELTTFGYMRDKWKQCEMNNHYFPPQYLIRIIYAYYWHEFVHLFTNFGDHYSMDIFALFDF